jgi:cobalt-zinc-cadmium efflux system membrane fusion protein
MINALVRTLLYGFLVLVLSQCNRISEAKTTNTPTGQVWLTPSQMKDAKLEMGVVQSRLVSDTIISSGRVSFDDLQVSHVFSPVTGRVVKIAAKTGQRVKKGDSLAFIDSPDVGVASAELNEALADLQAAQHEFERQRELYTSHAGSLRDFETAQDAFAKSKAELERARQKTRLLRGSASDAVSQNFVLRAPIEGEVLTRTVTPGMDVQGQYAGGTAVELFTIGELDPIWLLSEVYEVDVPRVKPQAVVEAELIAYANRKFEGRVDWVSETLDPSTRTARVRAIVPNPKRELKPEMYATVTIHVPGETTLTVPRKAVLHFGETTLVFVQLPTAPDGRLRFERRPVVVDEDIAGEFMPVLHGLQEGEKVVVSGAILLSAMA